MSDEPVTTVAYAPDAKSHPTPYQVKLRIEILANAALASPIIAKYGLPNARANTYQSPSNPAYYNIYLDCHDKKTSQCESLTAYVGTWRGDGGKCDYELGDDELRDLIAERWQVDIENSIQFWKEHSGEPPRSKDEDGKAIATPGREPSGIRDADLPRCPSA